MTINTGWTPPDEKKCPRCGVMHTSQLYLLCDVCREGDELAEYLSDPRSEEERNWDALAEDEAATIRSIRPGG